MSRNYLATLSTSSSPTEICTLEEPLLGSLLLLSGFGTIRIWLKLVTGETIPLLQETVADSKNCSSLIAGFGFTKGDRVFAVVLHGEEVTIQFSFMALVKTIRLRVQIPTQDLLYFPALIEAKINNNILSFISGAQEFPLLIDAALPGQTLAFRRVASQALINSVILKNDLSWVPIFATRESSAIASILELVPVRELVVIDSLNSVETINFRLVPLVAISSEYQAREQLAFRRL